MTKKMGQIEFLRLLFMLLILYGHLMQHFIFPHFGDMPIFVELKKHTSYAFGYLCEAFFVISGFLLSFSFERKKHDDFFHFSATRFARLAPVAWFELIVRGIFRIIDWGKFSFYGNLTALLFIPNALTIRVPTMLNWFVGSLFWASVLYYLLWKIIDSKKFYYVVAFITLCVYCVLLHKLHLYNKPEVWNDIFPFFLLRAIAGIGLGLLFGAYFLKNKHCEISQKEKIIWSLVDLILLVNIVNLSIVSWYDVAFPAIMTCFVILFYSFIFKVSYIAMLVGCKFVMWAAKYAYSVYIMQFAVFVALYHLLYFHPVWGVRQYPVGNIIFSLCTVCLVSIVVYHLVESPLRKLILAKLAARQAEQRS